MLRWDWIRFIEVGTDKDHVHYPLQSTPDHSPAEIVRLIKSVTSKRVFAEHPEVKKMLWGGEFWSDGYFVSSVGKFTSENVIREYMKNQGKEESYRQLYLNLRRENNPRPGLILRGSTPERIHSQKFLE